MASKVDAVTFSNSKQIGDSQMKLAFASTYDLLYLAVMFVYTPAIYHISDLTKLLSFPLISNLF